MEQSPDTPTFRQVTAGRMEGDLYLITLDGGEVVETIDEAVAHAAAQARRDRKEIAVVLEAGANGRQRLIEITETRPIPPSTVPARVDRPSQALTKAPELPHGLIVNPEELAVQMRTMSQHYNVLSPAIAISQMAPGYGANMAVVVIDPTVTFSDDGKSGSGPDCYWSKFIFQGDKSKRALNKQGLTRISQAAGVQWDPTHCRRLDNGRERNYWRWQYYGGIRTHDGQWQPLTATRELDLRDGSAEALGMASVNQLNQARARGNEICETKAMQRAIRALGIKQVYTVDELKKPFLIVRFSFTPDMSDPEIKKLVTERAMSGMGQLYAPPPAAALPAIEAPADDIDDAMPTTTGPGDKSQAKPKADPFAEPSAGQSSAADPVTVVKVDKSTGKNAKSGRAWTLYKVTFSTGEVAATFSETLHQLIDEASAHKAPVKYATVENPGYDDKLESFSIVDNRQPSLPGTEPAGGY